MKVLLVNQFFWPDASATSQLMTDLARGLAARGHRVHTLSAAGRYSGADAGQAPPATMRYVRTHPFGRGKIGRVLSYGSFYLSAARSALTMPRMDVVVTLTTPPLLSLLGTAVKLLRGSRHLIWEADMYPDIAVDCGYIRSGGAIDRVTGALADWSRRRADGVMALGECMRDRLLARGTPPEKIFVSYCWADGDAVTPLPFTGSRDRLTVLYSGNLGLAHDFETIFGAIRGLRDDPRFRFLFVGGGGRLKELAAFVAEERITSVERRPFADRAALGASLALGDIGLVTQKDVCSGSVVPSKVYGLLAAGRPVLFIGPATATPARIVREFDCGWHVPVGDVAGTVALLHRLADRPELVRQAGARARAALLARFDLPHGLARMTEIIEATGSARPAQGFAVAPGRGTDAA